MDNHYLSYLLVGCLGLLLLSACDQSAQNVGMEPGSSLRVNGPTALVVPNFDSAGTAEYMARAFTLEQEYSWSVEGGASLQGTRRDGEVAIVTTSEPGSYTVSLTTTVDGEEYSGSASGSADYPTLGDQTGRYNKLSTFGSELGAAGLDGALNSTDPDEGLNGWTAFAPSNAAFLNAFDEDDSEELEDGELPAAGILAKVLQYHVLVDSLTTSEFSGQSSATWLHEEENLTTNSGDPPTVDATNTTANMETPDIATNDGVIHQVDEVLLPSALVSFNDQTATRGGGTDTVTVEGTYIENPGFVVVEDSETSDVLGHSEYLDSGFHDDIKVTLDDQMDEDLTMIAKPYEDDGDTVFSSTLDSPYTRGSSSEDVMEEAEVAAP